MPLTENCPKEGLLPLSKRNGLTTVFLELINVHVAQCGQFTCHYQFNYT